MVKIIIAAKLYPMFCNMTSAVKYSKGLIHPPPLSEKKKCQVCNIYLFLNDDDKIILIPY